MQYDDGYFELIEEEKRQAELTEDNTLNNMNRVYKIRDGDVIVYNELLLEFEDNMFYEVEQKSHLINPTYKRTGRSYSPKELNSMFK